jgi:hypothetical protein
MPQRQWNNRNKVIVEYEYFVPVTQPVITHDLLLFYRRETDPFHKQKKTAPIG